MLEGRAPVARRGRLVVAAALGVVLAIGGAYAAAIAASRRGQRLVVSGTVYAPTAPRRWRVRSCTCGRPTARACTGPAPGARRGQVLLPAGHPADQRTRPLPGR